MIKPIFIFSMPRSGSTLLQKILMSHNKISSHSEPWFLLGMASLYEYENVKSDFAQGALRLAVKDMINSFEHNEDDLLKYIKEFSLNIYSNLSKYDSLYFIDKTPRYFLIIDFIAKLFPDAKFIFLTRNPLDIMVSYITSFNNNTISCFDQYDKDFNTGFTALSEGYLKYKDRSILVNYEELVGKNKDKIITNIFQYLELENDLTVLNKYNEQNLDGNLGDKNINAKKKIEFDNDKWKKNINNSFRKKQVLELVSQVPIRYYELSNIDKQDLINKIQEYNVPFDLTDTKDFYLTKVRRKIKKLLKWNRY